MRELPEGWVWTEVGSLCTLRNGRAFKPSEWTDSGLPIVRIQNLNNPRATFNRFDGHYDERYVLEGGELLFAWSGTPGTSFGAHIWRGGKAVLNQHIFRVDFPGDRLDKRFLRHAINQKLEELIDIAHGGVGLRHVTKGKFEETKILVPPLPEQKRIADRLDSLFARVDACRERLDRIPAILKRFRQAVLEAATSGRLTEEWREERGESAPWKLTTFGEVTRDLDNGLSKRHGESGIRTRVLRLADFRKGIRISGSEREILLSSRERSRFRLESGDVLVVRVNGSRSLAGLFISYEQVDGAVEAYCDHFIRLRPDRDQALPQYLVFVAQSTSGRKAIEAGLVTSAGQNTINQNSIGRTPLLLPSIREQEEVIRRAKELLATADALEKRYTAAQRQVEALTPALLAKAFRGELVPQDPDDEPAAVLLERIQAERNTGEAKPRRGRRARARE